MTAFVTVMVALSAVEAPHERCMSGGGHVFREEHRPSMWQRIVHDRKGTVVNSGHCLRCGFEPQFWDGILLQLDNQMQREARLRGATR